MKQEVASVAVTLVITLFVFRFYFLFSLEFYEGLRLQSQSTALEAPLVKTLYMYINQMIINALWQVMKNSLFYT